MSFIPELKNIVDSDNSSTTPLAASATFTGTGVDTTEYSTITVNCFSDQDCTLIVRFSSDNSNWDVTESFDVTAGVGFDQTVNTGALYYSIQVVNGAVAQSTFRLQSMLTTGKSPTPEEPLPFTGLESFRLVSTNNSSTTPLASSATFTGVGETSIFNTVLVNWSTDAAGTLYIDYSPDNVTWTSSSFSGYRVEADIPAAIKETIKDVYYRIRFVNGTTAQTTLNLVSITGQFDHEFLSTYEQIIRKNTGLVADESNLTLVGYTTGLTTSYKDVWGSTGNMVIPTTAETYEIVSSNAADTSAGIGARMVSVTSLDASGEIQTQLVTMNGTTAVTLTGTHTFPRFSTVIDSGSNNRNVGDITIRVSGGGNVRQVIPADESNALPGIYKVPSNHEFHITDLDYHTGDASKKVTVRSVIMPPGSTTWITTSVLPFSQQSFTRNFDETSARFAGGTIVKYEAKVSSGSGDDVAVILSGFEKRIR